MKRAQVWKQVLKTESNRRGRGEMQDNKNDQERLQVCDEDIAKDPRRGMGRKTRGNQQ